MAGLFVYTNISYTFCYFALTKRIINNWLENDLFRLQEIEKKKNKQAKQIYLAKKYIHNHLTGIWFQIQEDNKQKNIKDNFLPSFRSHILQ